MCRQIMGFPLHMCSGFPTEILEQMIMTSLYDVMRAFHVILGGKYKKESMTEPGGLAAGAITVIWVFLTQHLGL